MSLFDLLFLACALMSFGTVVYIAILACMGEGKHALRILLRLGIAVAIYLSIDVIVAKTLPAKIVQLGELQCGDDWCIAVDDSTHSNGLYDVDFRLHSRARRVAQRENGISVYLIDDHRVRYEPVPNPSEVPFNVLLGPGETVKAVRSFRIPDSARGLRCVFAHDADLSFGKFIIGRSPFDGTTIIPL